MTRSSQKPIVLLVIGAGRSGTTLVSSILGQLDNHFSAGELNYFWDAGLTKNQLCSCGEKLRECPIWAKIINRRFESSSLQDFSEYGLLSRKVIRRLNIPALRYPFLMMNRLKQKWGNCLEIYENLYEAIAEATDSRVIIDISKDPSHALFLARSKKIDLYLLHVVRDARAVAYSRQRKKKQVSKVGKEEFMPIQSYEKTSIKWLGINLISEFFLKHLNYRRISYESLVSEPDKFIFEMGRHLGFDQPIDTHIQKDKTLHTALGNPGRFNFSSSDIKPDVNWKKNMGFLGKLRVTIITWPLLLRYGFFSN